MSTPAIIECRNVSKSFDLPQGGHSTLRGRVLHPRARARIERFDALAEVGFQVERGGFFGIVGRNGSGKSTLLKLLAGIYHPNSGSIDVRGSLAPFIELGVGFNPDLSGRENLVLNGVLLGLTRRELRLRYDEIVEFAELEDFMDLKLRNFSSGMQVRLAFSIALQAGADIMLIDEVLAVGDERFQRKCYETFVERKRSNQTVVFVSHDMSAVTRFCDEAILLDHGRIVDEGSPRSVSLGYYDLNLASSPQARTAPARVERDAQGESEAVPQSREVEPGAESDTNVDSARRMQIVRVWGEDKALAETDAMPHGENLHVAVKVRANTDIIDPNVVMVVTDNRGNTILFLDSLGGGVTIPGEAGQESTVRFRILNYLAEGWYWIRIMVQSWDGIEIYDSAPEAFRFQVTSLYSSGGVIDLPNRVLLGDDAIQQELAAESAREAATVQSRDGGEGSE